MMPSKKLSWYVRTGIEVGGNLPYSIDWLSRKFGIGDSSLSEGLIGNKLVYGQFARYSIEGKICQPLGKNSMLILRNYIGVASSFGSTKIIPFENRFFTGGTGSIRGWQSNTLGPGTYQSDNNLITPGGEYIFEFNAEWRKNLFYPFEIACFTDAGNVWFAKNGGFDDARGKLSKNTLLLGLDAGIGIRLNFSFIVVRLDIGQQIYAPDLQDFVIKNFPQGIGKNRTQYNFGIGYPF